VRTDNMKMHT